MIRKTDTDHDRDAGNDENLSPEQEKVRVRQTKESVQDAIAKLTGEPVAAPPTEADGSGDPGSGDHDRGTRDVKHSPIPETGKH
ncbi:hypothetical protein [Sphingomonas sp. OK281]|uniref:hypothetical protein n=1 Tax=Sphingomonas sp. OK281 TaxID=1881067 RepID=UPI0008ECE6F2|nr:hypothetical protein [Sphingomonas sp. OK281]SFO19027.1 hypothetical protein SAMN05428984_2632 [Sphingomonas sp. OK281]